jgi:hypothetical protein
MPTKSLDQPLARNALAAGESVIVYTKSTLDMISFADDAANAFATAKPKTGVGLVVLATAAASQKVFAVAKPIVSGRDQIMVNRIEKIVNAAISCGGLVLSIGFTAGTGGLGIVVAATQGLSCGKDLVDVWTTDNTGQGWFDRSAGRQWFALGLDTVGTLGSLFALGRRHVARSLIDRVGRGLTHATKAERIALATEFGGLGLKGAGVILETWLDGTVREMPAERGRVEAILDESGLPWRNPLFDPECFYFRVSPRCLLGEVNNVRSR